MKNKKPIDIKEKLAYALFKPGDKVRAKCGSVYVVKYVLGYNVALDQIEYVLKNSEHEMFETIFQEKNLEVY